MIRTVQFLALPLLLLTSSLAAAAPSLRIDMNAVSSGPVLTPLEASRGLKLEHPWWIREDSRRPGWLWATGPELKDHEWRKFRIRFSSDRNTVVSLRLTWSRTDKGNARQWGAYRNLAARGFVLRNNRFREGGSGWEMTSCQLLGNGAVAAANDRSIAQRIFLKAGVQAELSGEYRMAEESELAVVKPEKIETIRYQDFELRFNSATGIWKSLSRRGVHYFANPDSLPPFRFQLEQRKQLSPGHSLVLKEWNFDPRKGILRMAYSGDGFRITEIIRFESDALTRRAEIVRTEKVPVKFYGFRFLYPLTKDGGYYFPATFWSDNTDNRDINAWPGIPVPYSPLPAGRFSDLTPQELTGYFRIWPMMVETLPGKTMLFLPDFRRDEGHCSLFGGRHAPFAQVFFDARGWAEPGKVQRIDEARTVFASGTPQDVLRNRVWNEFRRLDLAAPPDRPADVFRARIYEWFVYGGNNAGYSDLGTFRAVEKSLLDRVAGLGFNTVWQSPAQENNGVVYAPRDYYKPAQGAGSYDSLRHLIAKAHEKGIKLWMDIVPHGNSPDNSGRFRGNSPWSCVFTEDGNLLNDLAFDYNSPEWQNYMRGVAGFYTGDLGADGVRIDYSVGSYYPNWRRRGYPAADFLPGLVFRWNPKNVLRKVHGEWYESALKKAGGEVPPLEYERASHAVREGSSGMIRAIREGVRKGRRNATVLSEGGGPTLIRNSDLVHDRQFSHVIFKLLTFKPREFTRHFALWLTEQRFAEPAGALWMRITGCHDNPAYENMIGLEAARAYIAAAYFVHGVPLTALYPSDRGNGSFFRRLNALRDAIPQLNTGTPDYGIAENAPEVLRITRTLNGKPVVGLINFSRRTVTPRGDRDVPPGSVDLFNAHPVSLKNGKAEVTLPPWGVALLGDPSFGDFREKPMKTVKPVPGSVVLEKTAEFWRITTPNYRFVLNPKTGLFTEFLPENGTVYRNMVLLAANAFSGTPAVISQKQPDGAIRITVKLAGLCTLDYLCSAASVKTEVFPAGADAVKFGIGIRVPNADRWQIHTINGQLDDFYDPQWTRNRTGAQIGLSLYRPANPAIYYDTLGRPLNPELPLFAFTEKDSIRSGIRLSPLRGEMLPYAVLGDRFGNEAGLWVGMFASPVNGRKQIPFAFTLGTDFTEQKQEFPVKLVSGSSDYIVENGHYKLTLRRTGGVIRALEDKSGLLLSRQDIYAGARTMFSHEVLLSQDASTELSIRRSGEVLRLHFRGQPALRRPVKNNLPDPILFETEYIFDSSPTFRINYRLMRLAPLTGQNPLLDFMAEQHGAVRFRDLCGFTRIPGRNPQFRLFDKDTVPPIGEWQVWSMSVTPGTAEPQVKLYLPDFPPAPPFDPDLSFERRANWKTLPGGKDLFFPLPFFETGFRFLAGQCPNIESGCSSDGVYALTLQRIGSTYRQPLSPFPLSPGKYRLSVAVCGKELKPELRKAEKPFLNLSFRYVSEKNKFEERKGKRESLPRDFGYRRFSMDFELAGKAFLPEFRFSAALDGGKLYLDEIRLEKLP